MAQNPNIFNVANPDTIVLTFNEKVPLRVRVAETDEDRMRGLSGKSSLEATEGLLFVFPSDGYHSIWMKDMHFPIDIMWVDAEGTIITIEKNVRPETFPKAFEPARPARYVIEVNSHFFESFNVQEGGSVTIPGYIE